MFKSKNTVSIANSERIHKLCLELPVCRGRWSSCILFCFFQLFNYLTTCQMEQMTHFSLLHANQPVVPEATPAPGFEHLMCHPRIRLFDQKLHTAKKPGKLLKGFKYLHRNLSLSKLFILLASLESKAENFRDISCIPLFWRLRLFSVIFAAVEPSPKKSFFDDLYGFGGDDVEALFNGISDNPGFSDNPGKCKGTITKFRAVFFFRFRDPKRVKFGLQIRFRNLF